MQFAFILCTSILLAPLLASICFAKIVEVSDVVSLTNATQNAIAGDTILIAPGTYVGNVNNSGDPGNLPNGRGYFWVGSSGTVNHPIVVMAQDLRDKPILMGSSMYNNYVFHVTGDYVVLKDLVITKGDKGVVFDNSSYSVLEDSEIFNTGAELVHVRDGSSYVKISRNKIYNSGNGGNGSVGEGIYIGTDQARWGADDVAQTSWGEKAVTEGYGGYDWRVENTEVRCNIIGGGVSAELLDIKEGTRYTKVYENFLIADSIGLKPGGQSYDDSFIDLKGVEASIRDNYFYTPGATVTKYISEVERVYPHVDASLTTDGHSATWCDVGDNDGNVCFESDNILTTQIVDPMNGCMEVFARENTSSLMNDSKVISSFIELVNSHQIQLKRSEYAVKGVKLFTLQGQLIEQHFTTNTIFKNSQQIFWNSVLKSGTYLIQIRSSQGDEVLLFRVD